MRKLEKPTVIPYLVGMGIGKDFVNPVSHLIDKLHTHYYGCPALWDVNTFTTEHMTVENYADQLLPVIQFIQKYGYAIKGPFEIAAELPSINVFLRKVLDLYSCVRPVTYFPGAPSPVLRPQNVNITIFRENMEDIYAGIGFLPGSQPAIEFKKVLETHFGINGLPMGNEIGFAVKYASKRGTYRLMRDAIEYAIKHGKKRVTIIAKHNIDKACDASFRRWGFQCADEEYSGQVFTLASYEAIKAQLGKAEADEAWEEAKDEGRIIVDSKITDDSFQQLLIRPEQYEVLVAPNMTGDYLSDFLAAQVGGLGIAPGANINEETNAIALFEATHGTAPDIAGLGIANPCSLLLSFAMMFDHLELPELANGLRKGIAQAIAKDFTTGDLHRNIDTPALKTKDFCVVVGKLAVGEKVEMVFN